MKNKERLNDVNKNPNCKGCVYLAPLSASYKFCDYIGLEEHPRGCPVCECNRRITKRQWKAARAVEAKARRKRASLTRLQNL